MSSSCSSGSCGSKKNGSCGSADAGLAQQKLAIDSSLGRIKNKILVMSGKGGVGKSTISTNLALGLADRGYKVGLMDVDLHGPDICRMLNLTERLEKQEQKNGLIPPMRYGDNLKVISLEYMMENRDDPVIWRGPLKVQAIRQFIANMDWGELDYLIIDAPPGTGDEPLTVSSTIKDARALVVTTPQEIALADVRKSLNFCKHVKMDVLGVVENMSGLICPHCSNTIELFKSGGGEKMAADFKVPFLGRIPLDPRVVLGGDAGKPYLVSGAASPAVEGFARVVANVEKATSSRTPLTMAPAVSSGCACGDTCNPDKCAC
jgi:ATP-binding protein involved in chromosome partitioning